MRNLTLAILFVAISAQAQTTGQFKGWSLVDKTLNSRMGATETSISLGTYIHYDLLNLLGGSPSGTFRNGTPVAANFMLWKAALSTFANDLSKVCHGYNQNKFNAETLETISHVCMWPNPSAKDEAVLEKYWMLHMGFQAPESEFEAWKTFALSSNFENMPATKVIEIWSTAILMNPHFLLRK